MNIAESLGLGTMVTGIGLLVVFLCLAILILIMIVLPKVSRPIEKRNNKETIPIVKIKKEVKQEKKQVIQPERADDTEIIAVLTAAVACMLQTTGLKLVIKSYKRVGSSAWKRTGRDSQILNNF